MKKAISVLLIALLCIYVLCSCARPGTAAAADTQEESSELVIHDLDGDGASDYSVDFGSLKLTYSSPAVGTEEYVNTKKGIYIRFMLTPDAKAVSIVPGFVNDFIDHKNIEYLDIQKVCDSGYAGETIAADNDSEKLSAWLIDTKAGVFSIVVKYRAKDTKSYEAICSALNGLKINYEIIPAGTINIGG